MHIFGLVSVPQGTVGVLAVFTGCGNLYIRPLGAAWPAAPALSNCRYRGADIRLLHKVIVGVNMQ